MTDVPQGLVTLDELLLLLLLLCMHICFPHNITLVTTITLVKQQTCHAPCLPASMQYHAL
jgi:hypothetical protein